MESALTHILKAGLLAAFAATFVLALLGVFRFLYARPDQLLPIAVIRDNKADKQMGLYGSELLQQQLINVKQIVEWTSHSAAVSAPLPQVPTQIKPIDLKLTAFGLDIAGILNWIGSLSSYRSRIGATILIDQSSVTISASYEGPLESDQTGSKMGGPPWRIEGAQSVDEAIFHLAANITRLRSAEQEERFQKVSDEDFYEFVLAVRDLRNASSAVETSEATRLRTSGRTRLEALANRDTPTGFADAYTRLGELYEEENRQGIAVRMYERSLTLIDDGRVAAKVANLRQTVTAGPPAPELPTTRGRVRPLRPGYSVGGASGTAGTLGAFVRDAEGRTYILGAAHVLAGDSFGAGTPVLQPGPFDGGDPTNDRVATFSRFTRLQEKSPISALVGLAEIDPGTEFNNDIPGIGKIRGVRKDPFRLLGVAVRMLGRTSGVTNGSVVQVGLDFKMVSPNPENQGSIITFEDAIATTSMSAGGDSGAMVVDTEGNAVGIVVAGSESMTILAPISDVLDALGVELIFTGD